MEWYFDCLGFTSVVFEGEEDPNKKAACFDFMMTSLDPILKSVYIEGVFSDKGLAGEPANVWFMFQNVFGIRTLQDHVRLLKEMKTLTKKPNQTIEEYSNEHRLLRYKLAASGNPLTDQNSLMFFLSGLSHEECTGLFDRFAFRDTSKITFLDAYMALIQLESAKNAESQLLSKQVWCSYHKSASHSDAECRDQQNTVPPTTRAPRRARETSKEVTPKSKRAKSGVWCRRHQCPSHSTEDCRSTGPIPEAKSKTWCKFHACSSHDTADCRRGKKF